MDGSLLETWQLVVLALIQGLTEFLPVSSSAHLILPSKLLGWADQGPLIDVMAHFGSLFAVMIYFQAEVGRIFLGLFDLFKRNLSKDAVLALNLIVATPPVLLLGALMVATDLTLAVRSPVVIAITSIVFGVVLWLADLWGRRVREMDTLTWKGAFGLGLAQMLALIPGMSRSGITMTAALGMGFSRVEAARFSMLMSLPVIGAGGLFSLLSLMGAEDGGASLGQGLVVAGLSFVAAYAAIALFMRWVPKIGMFPFMIYRVALGIILLVMFL